MFCPKCGTQNQDNAAFCGGCGNALNSIPTPPAMQQPVQPEMPVEQSQPIEPSMPVEQPTPVGVDNNMPTLDTTSSSGPVSVDPSMFTTATETPAPVGSEVPPVAPVEPAMPGTTPAGNTMQTPNGIPMGQPIEGTQSIMQQQPMIQNQAMQGQPMMQNQQMNGYNNYNTNGPVAVNPSYVQMAPANGAAPNKSNNKALIIVGAIFGGLIVLAVLGTIISSLFGGKTSIEEKKALESKYSDDSPILISENDLYGFINTKGEHITEFIYKEAYDFDNGYAIVYGKGKVDDTETNVYMAIDTSGKVVKTFEDATYMSDCEHIKKLNQWLIASKVYDSSLKQITDDTVKIFAYQDGYYNWYSEDNAKGGIMNDKGKITYTYTFGEKEDYIGIEPSYNAVTKENYCRTNVENKKYAIVNCDTGKVIYDYTTKYIYQKDGNIFQINVDSDFKQNQILFIHNDKVAYTGGEKVSLYYYSDKPYIEIYDSSKSYDDKYSYYVYKTKEVVTEEPSSDDEEDTTSLEPWEEYTGYTLYESNDKYGLMNGDKIVVPASFDGIDYINLDVYKYMETKGKKLILVVDSDDKWSLYDIKSKSTVFDFKSEDLYFGDSVFMYYKQDSAYYLYNLITEKTTKTDLTTISSYCWYSSCNQIKLKPNYVIVSKSDGTKSYYNKDMEIFYTNKDK